MKAVRMSAPPKQILVVIGSGIGWCSMWRPSGEMTVIPPLIRVATQIRPSASSASEFEALIAADPRDEAPAMRRRPGLLADRSGLDDIEGPEPRRLGFGDIQGLFVRRQADPVGRHHRERDLGDARSIGSGVIDRTAIHLAGADLAEISKIKAALPVEDEIVRTF